MHTPRLQPLATAVALFTLLLAAPAVAMPGPGKNPCHEDKSLSGLGVTCTGVWLPPQLCDKCKLKPFLPNGDFAECSSIYNMTDVECHKQLVMYAQANKDCDPVRLQQTKDFSIAFNRMQLDLFVYSLCEECCDCVPFGSFPEQYDARLQAGTLLSVYRGNCPAHARFDVCRTWPKIKYTMQLGDVNAVRHEDWPEVCPLMKSWINSPAGQNWVEQPAVSMDGRIARFLGQLLGDASCGARSTWTQCTALERAQERL